MSKKVICPKHSDCKRKKCIHKKEYIESRECNIPCVLVEDDKLQCKSIVKRGIIIEYKCYMSKLDLFVEIKKLVALKNYQLPREYTAKNGSIWLDEDMKTEYINQSRTFMVSSIIKNEEYMHSPLLREGEHYPLYEFNKALNDIRRAGKMLRKINKKRQRQFKYIKNKEVKTIKI